VSVSVYGWSLKSVDGIRMGIRDRDGNDRRPDDEQREIVV
jgi:hypothetical protein